MFYILGFTKISGGATINITAHKTPNTKRPKRRPAPPNLRPPMG